MLPADRGTDRVTRLSDIPSLVRNADVRVLLDRDAILRIDPRVVVEIGTVSAVARVLSPPWFFVGRRLAAYDTPGATNYTMAALAAENWIPRDPRGIPPLPLAVLCYRLPQGLLCIDGNHRFLTVLRDRPDAPLVTVIIEGPMNADLLPDLAHWA